MKKIQMVDLQGQYNGIKDQLNASMQEVIDSARFINGPEVHSFQKELETYLDVKHVIPCANGTDALQVAMMGLGLKPGDEVITVDFTFASTVEVIALLGLTPILVDIDPVSFNIDISAIKKAITPKTRAIVPVHLFGLAADMEPIMDIARENNLFVIEDNAQGLGSYYRFKDGTKRKTGTIGHVASTSFFPSKNLGCYGDGGAIFTNDDELAHIIRGIVNHGMYKRYHHDVIGVNSRLDSLQAAVLRAKLPKLDSYNSARRKSARSYTNLFKGIAGITTPKVNSSNETGIEGDHYDYHVFHQYTLKIEGINRDALVQHLNSKDIPCGVYYPIPLHSQKAYTNARYREEDFMVTNKLVNQVISLPMHTELEHEQIEFIVKTVIEFVNSNRF